MQGAGKTSWKRLSVHGADRGERLAALYRFQNREACLDHAPALIVADQDGDAARLINDPADVDWSGFPVIQAIEAVTHEELCRLRSLLSAGDRPLKM